jgi:hypothetical protein
VAPTTIAAWVRTQPTSFRAVTVEATRTDVGASTRAVLTLITPSGHRLEGLDLEAAAILLARLA